MNMYNMSMRCVIISLLSLFSMHAEEFIVTKKVKNKKESVACIKKDILDTLESCLRQTGRNIQHAVCVQNKLLDQLKDMLIEDQMTAAQLQEVRNHLAKNIKIFEQQQADLEAFLRQSLPSKSL